MKRLLLVMILLSTTLWVHAIGDCDSILLVAMNQYNNGQYIEAIENFQSCCNNCPDYKDICIRWINDCEKAIKRKEEEKKKRMKSRKEKGLAYFSVHSDVPGKFSKKHLEPALKEGIRYTEDSIEAYWFVRINVTNLDESDDASPCYYVFADVEVNNATASSYNSVFFEEYGTYSKTISDRKSYIANQIYESHNQRLFKNMKASIMKFIEVTDNDIISDSVVSYDQKQENVGIYIFSSPNDIIKKRLLSRLKHNFKKANRRYNVIDDNENEDYKMLIREIYDFQEHYFFENSQTVLNGHSKVPHKLCIIDVANGGNGLEFFCTFKEFGSNVLEKSVSYPRSGIDVNVFPDSEKERIETVADVLAYQLDLLSEKQQKELENRIERFRRVDKTKYEKDSIAICDSIEKMIKEDISLAWWPGQYQRYYGQKTKDCCMVTKSYFYPIAEGISVLGIVVSSLGIGYNVYMGRKTTDPVDRERYKRCNDLIWIPAFGGSIGAAVGIYLFNIGDAHHSIHQTKNAYIRQAKKARTICTNPVITNESIVLTLNINF